MKYTKYSCVKSPCTAKNLLRNLHTAYSRIGSKVTAYFDEFPNCTPGDSINYFLQLGLYEPKMMSPEERRRWLRMHFVLDYADGKTESDVYCEYLLECDGIEGGTAHPKPVDHRVKISSRPKKRSREEPDDKP